MPRVFVGAGSNANPRLHLQQAVEALAGQFDNLACSPVVQSRARGGGAPYWNAVLAFDAGQSPTALRDALRAIEADAGRERGSGGCTLDLDLLLVGDVIHDADGLQLPRPDILRDTFVLYPLSLLAPKLLHPQRDEAMQALWVQAAAQGAVTPLDVGWAPSLSD